MVTSLLVVRQACKAIGARAACTTPPSPLPAAPRLAGQWPLAPARVLHHGTYGLSSWRQEPRRRGSCAPHASLVRLVSLSHGLRQSPKPLSKPQRRHPRTKPSDMGPTADRGHGAQAHHATSCFVCLTPQAPPQCRPPGATERGHGAQAHHARRAQRRHLPPPLKEPGVRGCSPLA